MIYNFSDLSYNDLGSIDVRIFGGTSYVGEDLFLNSNNLVDINYYAFHNVTLRYIWLNDNLLTIYPQALLSQNPQRM